MTGQARVAPELAKAATRQEVLGLAVGAASSCWSNLEGAGEFDSSEARLIVEATLDRLQAVDTVPIPTERVLWAVRAERQRQGELGYTAEHDDAEGLEHILAQARDRTKVGYLKTRDDLVEAAALLVAAIEWMDRVAPSDHPGVTQ